MHKQSMMETPFQESGPKMTVSEPLKMLSLMESAGLGDKKIIVLSESETIGFVKSWSTEDEAGETHCCALWLEE